MYVLKSPLTIGVYVHIMEHPVYTVVQTYFHIYILM